MSDCVERNLMHFLTAIAILLVHITPIVNEQARMENDNAIQVSAIRDCGVQQVGTVQTNSH